MAKQASYCLPYRRRRNGKTDYRARKAFILSGKPRIVVRGSLRHMLAQVISAKPHGDKVLVAAHSRELAKYGWKASEGNLPAAYLTGFLCGLKAKTEGVDEAILDVGLHSPTKGARIFAALKGVLDAGVEVPHSEEKLPENERIDGKHVAEYAKSLASIPESYQTRFSKYLEQKLSPENLPEIFANVKKEIAEEFKKGGKKA